MDTGVLLHAPDLWRTGGSRLLVGCARLNPDVYPRVTGTDLQRHVIRAGGQQAAGGIPLDGVHLILQ